MNENKIVDVILNSRYSEKQLPFVKKFFKYYPLGEITVDLEFNFYNKGEARHAIDKNDISSKIIRIIQNYKEKGLSVNETITEISKQLQEYRIEIASLPKLVYTIYEHPQEL